MPRVSVVIPVHNRLAYLGDAIASVLAQTYRDFEVIVVDDASTDGSEQFARACEDPRVRVLTSSVNVGPSGARNAGIAAARGEYVALLDSDDRALPLRLERQVAFLDHHASCAAVSGWVHWIDRNGRRIGTERARATRSEVLRAQTLFRCPLRTPATTARTAVLRAHPYSEHYWTSEDFDVWSRIAMEHEIATIPRFLGECRKHPARISKGPGEEARSEVRREIFARQLSQLGIEFSHDDLLGHEKLRRVASGRLPVDEAYVDWAQGWLLKLRVANREARIYPEPGFDDLLREYWLACCWRSGGWLALPAAVRRWRESPLAGAVLPILGEHASRYALRGWARCLDLGRAPVLPSAGEPDLGSKAVPY